MKTTVLSGQSLLDISVQTAGSVESVFGLAAKNGLSVTDSIEAGTETSDVPEAANGPVADYFRAKNLRPATGFNREDNFSGGIGFMAVEINFIPA